MFGCEDCQARTVGRPGHSPINYSCACVAKTSATGTLSSPPAPPHSVGRGEKNYHGVFTPPEGVKTPFFYVSLPIERGIRLGKLSLQLSCTTLWETHSEKSNGAGNGVVLPIRIPAYKGRRVAIHFDLAQNFLSRYTKIHADRWIHKLVGD